MKKEVKKIKRRILLVVAYDGTEYNGWQIQPEGVTIEGILNDELGRVLGEEIKVIGASRTDSGVHAEGAVCVFDTFSSIPGDKFSYALNKSLPEDIKILASKEVSPDFHPRKTECRKTYMYRIWNDRFPLPTNSRYTTLVYTDLDVVRMREAAVKLSGTHDFKSFCSINTQAESTVRTIYDIDILQKGKEIDILITGNGFLYNMVRIIAGTLIEVGQGKYEPEDIESMLDGRDRSLAGQTAPAKGLTLMGYKYKEV
ncbi:MAG: tRNA pseudouridine(38-40) synthase TruA [Lachnospiraceae bacterium]|nr:tRNA pseudouridine(38-40) synthase TruA [Lachnospiraceae bacterium]